MKSENKTVPTKVSVDEFLSTVSSTRAQEARVIIEIMKRISKMEPVMWGPSIIGFGTTHYKYETGREGDMPILGFSPRKASLTVYIGGFDKYGDLLEKLGKHSTSVSCLYIPRLDEVDVAVLEKIIKRSFEMKVSKKEGKDKVNTVDQYRASLRGVTKERFVELEKLINTCVKGESLISYGVPCIKVDNKPVVYFASYRDHVSIYPVPKAVPAGAKEYVHGKGTFWFLHDQPIPREVIQKIITQLANERLSKV